MPTLARSVNAPPPEGRLADSRLALEHEHTGARTWIVEKCLNRGRFFGPSKDRCLRCLHPPET